MADTTSKDTTARDNNTASLSSFNTPVGMTEQKHRELVKMKLVAGGLLGLAAIIFLLCLWLEKICPHIAMISFVKAAAEAGMVGGFADWFAVTALFRHPLGVKIPHTAIIPKKKDYIGNALGDFIKGYFLTADNVAEKISTLNIPDSMGKWLKSKDNSTKLSNEVSHIVSHLLDSVSDDAAQRIIQSNIIDRLAEPDWGPPLGKLLKYLLDNGKHLPLIDVLVHRAHSWALNAGDTIDRVVNADMPKWAPKILNSLLGYKIHHELIEFIERVQNDPDHDMRKVMNNFLYELSEDLQDDPAMIDKVENIKQEILARNEVQNLANSTWSTAKKLAHEALENPHSALRNKFIESAMQFGIRLESDQALQKKFNIQIDNLTRTLVNRYSDQIVAIISETIQRWDAHNASKAIELNVGKDLQYIRLNGTIVGAIVGLIIYTIGTLLFH